MNSNFPVVENEGYLAYYRDGAQVGRASCELGLCVTFDQMREAMRLSHNYLLQLDKMEGDFWKLPKYFPEYDLVVFYNTEIPRELFEAIVADVETMPADKFFEIFGR